MVTIAALYHFFPFPAFADQRETIKREMLSHGIKGSLLIAAEGINGTIAGEKAPLETFLNWLRTTIVGEPITYRLSWAETMPFTRTKVRLKKETISLGEPVDLSQVGTYISPQEWNDLITQPGTIVLDTRNDYETHLGTFKGAIDPDIATFKELPAFVRERLATEKDTPIATFCTGGIRCEKFTAWMKQEGFTNVYHLQGGILKYLEEIPQSESQWQGECYVFDDRIAVGHGLSPSITASQCPACGFALIPEDRSHADYVPGKSCPHCTK